ncbi:Putative uncharacterized protein [Mycobacterium tuberculosis variant bovis]|uniref:Uncharacterized protein n=1 Tax=Mycobacterium tuberculosis (strain CDC 1551 / Oshkosh) TaxID=83331 RepID=Q8VJR4_MYCTO|nr:hypothetical protein MT2113 [Mycobacterium tuberculosis CDC1551]CEJ28203.1 Putative uncharacterized protein [Mycobacterium tuberculosis variant bovis]CEJ35805.1 Putative uncharacterized protein [Mycobacterium tuberculosis variant bovis]CEJ40670.1 Putative uncharacterized protein [Mycobacterium tuberculosis variant bovis]CEJ53380.1 Putative uncharacterized protein [Mycobacterium tuberculosis variant caprae]
MTGIWLTPLIRPRRWRFCGYPRGLKGQRLDIYDVDDLAINKVRVGAALAEGPGHVGRRIGRQWHVPQETAHGDRGQPGSSERPDRRHQQQQPHRRGDQTRNKHQDRGNGDQRAVTQCASWFRQAGSQPQEPSAELPATERRQQTEPEDERRQQHQQSPAKPDRRRQRENHRELDDGVAEQQPRHHVTPTSAG